MKPILLTAARVWARRVASHRIVRRFAACAKAHPCEALRHASVLLLLAAIVVVAGCRGPQVAPPPLITELALSKGALPGNPLSGMKRSTIEGETPVAVAAELCVDVRWRHYRTPLPLDRSRAVGAEVRFVIDPASELDFASLPRLATGLRWGEIETRAEATVKTSIETQSEETLLWQEWTRSWSPSEGVCLYAWPLDSRAAAMRVAWLLQISNSDATEWVLLPELEVGESRELWVPCAATGGFSHDTDGNASSAATSGHWRLRVDCRRGKGSQEANVSAAAILDAQREEVAESDAAPSVEDIRLLGLRYTTTQRPTLQALAEESGALLTREVAMVAKGPLVARLCKDLFVRLQRESTLPLGMRLERATLLSVAEMLESEEPAGVEALLVQHLGECGRHSTSLEQLAASSALEKLAERVLMENMLFLGASRAKSRVRAYDWLKARGVELDGYDPLSESDVRRSALRQLERKSNEVGR